jgi:hypothetical protein
MTVTGLNTGTVYLKYYFIVQRSVDGVHYEWVASVPVQNLPGEESYSYLDAQYADPCYYRLKQVDLNGYVSYSSVVIQGAVLFKAEHTRQWCKRHPVV